MKAEKNDRTAKERILEAAIRLFAAKGYGATGLREIVKEAGVSVAMVNYHFGSKQALLETIITEFFEGIQSIAEESLSGADLPEDKMRRYIHAMTAALRKDPNLVRVVITELPLDVPGILQIKAKQLGKMLEIFKQHLIPSLPEQVRDRLRLEILGPASAGMLTFHFLLGPVIERAFQIQFNDDFYQDYADELTNLFLYGVLGNAGNPPETTRNKNHDR